MGQANSESTKLYKIYESCICKVHSSQSVRLPSIQPASQPAKPSSSACHISHFQSFSVNRSEICNVHILYNRNNNYKYTCRMGWQIGHSIEKLCHYQIIDCHANHGKILIKTLICSIFCSHLIITSKHGEWKVFFVAVELNCSSSKWEGKKLWWKDDNE